MADTGDPLLLPTWLQVVVTGVVALVSGIFGAGITAVMIAVGITRKFAEMEKSFEEKITALERALLKADSERYHRLDSLLGVETGKLDLADEELGRRIGATEQEIAVLKDFKQRMERGQQNDRHASGNR